MLKQLIESLDNVIDKSDAGAEIHQTPDLTEEENDNVIDKSDAGAEIHQTPDLTEEEVDIQIDESDVDTIDKLKNNLDEQDIDIQIDEHGEQDTIDTNASMNINEEDDEELTEKQRKVANAVMAQVNKIFENIIFESDDEDVLKPNYDKPVTEKNKNKNKGRK